MKGEVRSRRKKLGGQAEEGITEGRHRPGANRDRVDALMKIHLGDL